MIKRTSINKLFLIFILVLEQMSFLNIYYILYLIKKPALVAQVRSGGRQNYSNIMKTTLDLNFDFIMLLNSMERQTRGNKITFSLISFKLVLRKKLINN